MNEQEPEKKQATISWITSLAITVTCCAVQFVVFAGYIFDIKESLSFMRVRMDMMDEHVIQTNTGIENLRRHVVVQQAQPAPSAPPANGTAVQPPVSLAPPGPDVQPAVAVPSVEVPKVAPVPPPATH